MLASSISTYILKHLFIHLYCHTIYIYIFISHCSDLLRLSKDHARSAAPAACGRVFEKLRWGESIAASPWPCSKGDLKLVDVGTKVIPSILLQVVRVQEVAGLRITLRVLSFVGCQRQPAQDQGTKVHPQSWPKLPDSVGPCSCSITSMWTGGLWKCQTV